MQSHKSALGRYVSPYLKPYLMLDSEIRNGKSSDQSSNRSVEDVLRLATLTYTNESPSATSKQYYLSDNMADFYFTFESGERVPAHKLLLTGSNVFQTMFNGSWEEEKEVKIVDASADAFKEFLQFFYLDVVGVSMENVAEVMNLGHKYNMIECVNACSKMLIEKHTIENACWGLELAMVYDRAGLMKLSKETIKSDTKSVLKTSGFLQCNKQVLSYIVKEDSLNCSEAELFGAVMSWVKAKTEQVQLTRGIIQAELGDLFYQFRFRSMTLKEFADLIPAYGHLFTREKQQDIIQLIASEDFNPEYFNNDIRYNSLYSRDSEIEHQVQEYQTKDEEDSEDESNAEDESD